MPDAWPCGLGPLSVAAPPCRGSCRALARLVLALACTSTLITLCACWNGNLYVMRMSKVLVALEESQSSKCFPMLANLFPICIKFCRIVWLIHQACVWESSGFANCKGFIVLQCWSYLSVCLCLLRLCWVGVPPGPAPARWLETQLRLCRLVRAFTRFPQLLKLQPWHRLSGLHAGYVR